MQILHTIGRDFWWDVARQCNYATFFHTPLWHEIAVRNHPNFHDASIGFVLDRGVRAVLPLLSTRRFGPFRNLLSTFEYCYGGLIADGSLTNGELDQLYRRACGWNVTGLRFLENPLAQRINLASQFIGNTYETHILELDSDFETIFKRFPKDKRNAYRKGLKEGVTIELAETLDDYRAYYGAYQDTIRRWGEDPASYGYRWSIFETIFDLSRSYPEQVKLWLARVNGTIIGGTVAFYWNRHVVAWHGCAYTDYLSYKPYVVIDVEIVRDAITRGYAYYDLNPTGDLSAGVSEYKARLGTTVYPITSWQYNSPGLQLGVRAFRSLRQMASRG